MHKNSNNDTFNWYKIVFKNPLEFMILIEGRHYLKQKMKSEIFLKIIKLGKICCHLLRTR